MATKVKILAALSSISILIVGYVIFFRSTISVESIPPGAKVFLNEQLIGQTPLEDHAVEPGDYRLEVLHSTFKKFESSLTIKSGDKITEEVELKPGVGRVELLSNPPGAWVEINGKRRHRFQPASKTASGVWSPLAARRPPPSLTCHTTTTLRWHYPRYRCASALGCIWPCHASSCNEGTHAQKQ